MRGTSIIELLFCCLILALAGALGLSYTRSGRGAASPRACLAPVEAFLDHARARGALAGETSEVWFDLHAHELRPSWNEPAVKLGKSCRLLSAGFGIGGRRVATAAYYPGGSASPGHVLVGALRGGACRLTIGIRGGKASRCSP